MLCDNIIKKIPGFWNDKSMDEYEILVISIFYNVWYNFKTLKKNLIVKLIQILNCN